MATSWNFHDDYTLFMTRDELMVHLATVQERLVRRANSHYNRGRRGKALSKAPEGGDVGVEDLSLFDSDSADD